MRGSLRSRNYNRGIRKGVYGGRYRYFIFGFIFSIFSDIHLMAIPESD
jgi:hypothetical protein